MESVTPESESTQTNSKRWLLTVPVMLLPLAASFFYFVWFPGTAFGNSFYVGVKVLLCVWPVIAVWLLLREKFADRSRECRHLPAIVSGTIFGILTVAAMFVLVKLTPVGEVVYGSADRINQRISDLGVKNHYVLFALFLSFIHAWIEEFFWRYFAFGQLRKLMPVAIAVLAAALGFALHHVVVLTQFVPLVYASVFGICVGLGGAVWSIIYHRYNSLWGAWVSHVLVDLGIMWIGWEILQMG